MRILIIEDDEYKCNDILSRLSEYDDIRQVHSVSTAVKILFEQEFDLIILDMALPTFEKREGAASGSSQPQGGVEVLRTVEHLDGACKILIISQYPGIEIDGNIILLDSAVKPLQERYAVSIVGAIFYDLYSSEWVGEFNDYISKI